MKPCLHISSAYKYKYMKKLDWRTKKKTKKPNWIVMKDWQKFNAKQKKKTIYGQPAD